MQAAIIHFLEPMKLDKFMIQVAWTHPRTHPRLASVAKMPTKLLPKRMASAFRLTLPKLSKQHLQFYGLNKNLSD